MFSGIYRENDFRKIQSRQKYELALHKLSIQDLKSAVSLLHGDEGEGRGGVPCMNKRTVKLSLITLSCH